MFEGIVTLTPDARPLERNSNGQRALFTCKTAEIARKVVDYFSQQEVKFDGVTESVKASLKLTKGELEKQKLTQK